MRDRSVLIDDGAVEAMQSTLDEGATAIGACYALIGAIMLLGGLGFLADRYFAISPWGLLIGLIAGLTIGFCLLARVVRRR